ncbi:MAG: hypothetical protein OXE78_05925 [Gammaproteobacteria bacterium]|nr:hypothetical protein [Gammaproteobacteria bacterium]
MTTFHIAIATIGISAALVLAAIRFAHKYGKWQGEVNTDRSTFKDFMLEVRADIKKILEQLPTPTIASSSPIRLTELGAQISEKLDAKAWAQAEAEKLIGETEGADALGIQETAFTHAQDFDPPKELLGKMRDSAFERGVDLSGVRDVLGVELRDVLLER